jgi:OmpR-family two-component system manganese-sensing sensor histidine kinase
MVQPRWSTISLPALLADVIEEQQAAATGKEIMLSLDVIPAEKPIPTVETQTELRLQEAEWMLQADREQLARLFTNLIGNAIQYTPKGGHVKLNLRSLKRGSGNSLQVIVEDNGIGIPAEALPQIYDRFYRVDPARSRSDAQGSGTGATGSGLGLAIAQAIVNNHQGQIRLDSVVNQGTTVTITLPQ